jgi:DNA-binding transcriptional MerR regulator
LKENQYRIGELAEKANVTRRTIHYYIGRGILPPADGAGAGATYSDEHLYRIMLVKKLQEAYLPLDEIKKRVVGLSLEEIKKIIDNNYLSDGYINNEANSTKMQVSDAEAEPWQYNSSIAYERVLIGLGVEIHFPGEDRKARKLVESLCKYAEKIMKEG